MTEWIANGPDGTELIGYLAGLGWLALVDAGAPAGASVTLRWERHGAGWRPRLRHPGTAEDGWDWLRRGLAVFGRAFGAECPGTTVTDVPVVLDPQWRNPRDATVEAWRERAHTVLAPGWSAEPVARDLLSAIVIDALLLENKKWMPIDTQLRMMQGNGGQHFLVFGRRLLEWATEDPGRIERSLHQPWTYLDESRKGSTGGKGGRVWTPSMRWDSRDSRPHAVLSRNPENDDLPEEREHGPKRRTEAGGTTLALGALRALTVFPAGTLGWARLPTPSTNSGLQTCFTWALHDGSLDLPAIAAMLRLPTLAATAPSAREVRGRGIEEVRRAARVMNGKYPAITSAWSVA